MTSPVSLAAFPLPRTSVAAREKLWVTALGALLGLGFCAFYLGHTVVMNEADPRLLCEFQGHRPYQTRILMPLLVHLCTRATGLDIARCYQLILMLVSVAFFPLFTAYLRRFCPPRAATWLGLGLIWPLLAFYSHKWFYLYDVPAAFLATAALLLMAQGRWRAYLLVFALATLNRETSAFLTLAFVLTQWSELPRRRFWALVAIQGAIWLGLRLILARIFASNAGSALEWHLGDNLATFGQIARGVVSLRLGFALASLGALWLIGWATRRAQPPFLRSARGVFWPFLALMSGVGVLSETRLYSELIPLLLAPALVGLFNCCVGALRPASR